MRGRGWSLAIVLLLCLVPAAPAFAHAERSASTPGEGARVKSPGSLDIQFTEPPIGDADFEVLDGCERDVVEEIEVQDTEITATLGEGQPGNWSVRTQVVSGIDGHATKDRWRFRVAGQADCEAAPPAGDDTAAPREEQEGGGSFLLIFAAGTLVLIAMALLLRRKASAD